MVGNEALVDLPLRAARNACKISLERAGQAIGKTKEGMSAFENDPNNEIVKSLDNLGALYKMYSPTGKMIIEKMIDDHVFCCSD